MEEYQEPKYKIKPHLIKLENAISCQGCQKSMTLLISGNYQCPHCGGSTTRFGGFWPYESLNLKTSIK